MERKKSGKFPVKKFEKSLKNLLTTSGTYAIIDFAVRDTRETEHSNVRVAQLDRASGYGPEGREFESSRAR